MKAYFIFSFVCCLLITTSCSDKISTEAGDEEQNGESYPIGPLRIVNSKLKSEKWHMLNTNMLLRETNYEYNNKGLLKTKTRTESGYKTTTEYFYDNDSTLLKVIETYEMIYVDTIHYRYNANNKLIRKETAHMTQNFVLYDTTFYKYDLEGNLAEWYRRNPYDDYKTITREKNEYSNGLLIKTYSYINDELNRTFEYQYYNNIKTKYLVYMNLGLLEYKAIYYYDDGLLRKEKGFWGNTNESTDQVIYNYNCKYELILKTVYVPLISSYVNHEIHYEYY